MNTSRRTLLKRPQQRLTANARAAMAAVLGSSFSAQPRDGARLVRFCFCKRDETLEEAGARLAHL